MLHAGLDLSRKCLDVCVLDEAGERVATTLCPPDGDGLRHLVTEVRALGGPVSAAIESMNGARFIHDTLELHGWDVDIADAQQVKGLAPLACKTDKIDAWVLAELSRRDLVPAIWLPTPGVRAERERARFRLHLVRHRVMLKNRIHATLLAFGKPCTASDLFGVEGRRLLTSAPEIGWVLGYTIASEIGDISGSPPRRSWSVTGLCPRVSQSVGKDHRGPLAKNGPKYLRWALIEAAVHAARHPVYAEHYQRTAQRLGRQRGNKVARVEVSRKLTEAVWHICQTGSTFAPARSRVVTLAA